MVKKLVSQSSLVGGEAGLTNVQFSSYPIIIIASLRFIGGVFSLGAWLLIRRSLIKCMQTVQLTVPLAAPAPNLSE